MLFYPTLLLRHDAPRAFSTGQRRHRAGAWSSLVTGEQPFDAIPKLLCNGVGHDVAVRLAQRMSQEEGRVNGTRIGNKPDRAPPHWLSPLVELKASNTESKSCLISPQSPDGD
jgi:hypothetical protein